MKSGFQIGILCIVAIIVLSANIGGYSIYILDEAKNSSCAREMLETGDWIVPTFNYELRADKPPLHYYFMAFAYKLFGVNEFAARFFSVVFGLLTLFTVFWFTRIHGELKAAKATTLILLSCIGFIVQFHLAVPDPYLIFFVVFGLCSLYHARVKSNERWLLISYSAFGFAVLSKGPVGVVIPLLTTILYFTIVKKENVGGLLNLKGIGFFLLIILPWFIAVTIETEGEWIRQFFLEHNVERFTTTKEGHGGSFLIIPLFFLLMLMPFSLFVIPVGIKFFKGEKDDLDTFCALATLVPILFFSFSATKLPNYVSLSIPFASILLGRYLTRIDAKVARPWVLVTAVILFSGPIIVATLNIDHINSEDWLKLVLLPVGGVFAMWFLSKGRLYRSVASISLAFSLTITLLFYTAVPRIDKQNPVSMSLIEFETDQQIAAFHIFNPAFSFYLKKKISVFDNKMGLENFLSQNEDVIVLTRTNVLNELITLPLDTVLIKQDLFESTKTAVLKKED